MKHFLLTVALILPAFAQANSLQFVANGSNFSFSNYNPSPNATGPRNVGQFGSFIIDGAGGGTFSATYLGQESGLNNVYEQSLSLGSQILDESSPGSTKSAEVFGPGILAFGFATDNGGGSYSGVFNNGDFAGETLGFVVLKQFLTTPNHTELFSAGYDNNTTYGTFDYLLGFNDIANVDADYDDFVIGIKYTPNAVPVPAALPLLASAVALFGLNARRRHL